MCIADQPSERSRRLRRPPRAGQGWAGGRPRGQVSSGRRRRYLPELASLGGVYRRQGEREGAAASRELEGERGSERDRLEGGEKKNEGRASERARHSPGGGGGERSARVRQPLCAPRTADRPLTSAEPRAEPRGQGGAGAGRRARPGSGQLAAARAARPFPAQPPPLRFPRRPVAPWGGRVRTLAGAGPGRGRAPGLLPAPRSRCAGLLVNGSAGPGPLAVVRWAWLLAPRAASLPVRFPLHLGSSGSPSWFLSCCWGHGSRGRMTSANVRRQWV